MSHYINLVSSDSVTVAATANRRWHKAAAMFALAVTLSPLNPALAQAPEPQTMSLKVFYGDLDLSSDAGRKVLQDRISIAATQVCGGLPGGRNSIQEVEQFHACRDHAIVGSEAFVTAAIDAANQKAAAAAANRTVASQDRKN